jgi:hypothetical protein
LYYSLDFNGVAAGRKGNQIEYSKASWLQAKTRKKIKARALSN